MEECLAYLRKAIADPASVPPWYEWWAANSGLVERVFPLFAFVRLKHRRLLDYRSPSPLLTGVVRSASAGRDDIDAGGPGAATSRARPVIPSLVVWRGEIR